MTPREVKVRCPRCTVVVRLPADQMRIVQIDIHDRVRFDCPDCGTVTRQVPFVAIAELVAGGMHPTWTEEDIVGFQVAMTWRDDLSDLADLEGASP